MEITFEKWEDGRWFVVLPDYDGPNPIPGMTTMQVSGVKPTLKKGGKLIKRK